MTTITPEVGMLIGIAGFLAMLIGMALGIHLGTVMALVGFVGCVVLLDLPKGLHMLVGTSYHRIASWEFVALPMFILMGEFVNQSGLGTQIYVAASKWLGRVRGGLAMATTASCALFGAVSGSSTAAVSVFGKLAIPEMKRYNFDPKLSSGVVACSGTLAVLIPPSGIMVLYTIITETSLGKLMIAGLVPGFLSAIIYMLMIYFRVRLNPSLGPPSTEAFSWKERWSAVPGISPVPVVMILMLGGIYMGVFSPTEAASVGAFILFLVIIVRRVLSWGVLKTALSDALRTSAMLIFVIMAAMVFGKFILLSGVPVALLDFVSGLQVSPIVVLVVILLIYIVLGAIMDVVSALIITVPLFVPMLHGLGFDATWIGILIIKIVEIGVVTPPIGINVYILRGVLSDQIDIPVMDMFRGVLPFFLMDVLTLAILVAFPQIILWLPSMMW